MMDNYWKEFQILEAVEGRWLLKRYDDEADGKKEYKVVFFDFKTVEILTTSSYQKALGWFNAVCEDEE